MKRLHFKYYFTLSPLGILFVFQGFLSLSTELKASHIVGGEMTYQYLGNSNGNNNYRVITNLFVDCKSSNSGAIDQDKTASLNVFVVNSGSFTLQKSYSLNNSRTGPVRVSDNTYKCIKNIPDVCVDKYTFTLDLSLPVNQLGYVITFERCCRNATITNIMNPGTTGALYWTKIPGSNQVNINSSPVFKYTPPTFICINAPLTFDHSAKDIDGDSLVYEMYTPFIGGSRNTPLPSGNNATNPSKFSYVTWVSSSGYNQAYQLDGNPTLSINRKNGKLSLTPTLTGQFVVGIKVQEYRKGVLIGETKRDVQFNVINCIFEVVSSFYLPAVLCSETNLVFQNQSQGGKSFFWDFGDTSLINDTSSLKSPTYAFKNPGVFTVKLVASTTICSDTFENEVTVKENFHAKLPNDTLFCGPFSKTFESNIKGKEFLWSTGDTSVSISINKAGIFWLLISDDPCFSSDSMVIQNDLSTMDLGPDSVICADSFIQFYYYGRPGYKKYTWSNGSTYDSFFVSKAANYSLQVTNQNGCLLKDSISFILYPPPALALKDSLFCRGTNVILNGINRNIPTSAESIYKWNNGGSGSSITVNDTGMYSVLVSNKYCSKRDTSNLYFIQTGLDLGLDTFYCGPVWRWLRPKADFIQYQWQDNSNGNSYLAKSPGKKKLTIISKDGCIESDSIYITQYPILDGGLGNDTSTCISSGVFLTAVDSMVSYFWNTGETSRQIFTMNKGIFKVTVSNSRGCINSDSLNISADYNAMPNELYIPNAFTPNNDQINDQFPNSHYRSPGSAYHFKIYDRWGEQLFNSEVPGMDWDGTYCGKECPQGIYIFMVDYIGCDGKERTFRGTFTLQR